MNAINPISCSDLVSELVKRWPEKEASTAPKERLLFVDDNTDYCVLFKQAFGKYGYYDIHVASTGEEGVRLFRLHQPFLVVFLDLAMPRMDGIEVFKKVRELNPLQYVVVITGALNEDFTKRLREFFCYGIAFKPIDFNMLAGILHSHINPPVA